jgi:hypothetical protein
MPMRSGGIVTLVLAGSISIIGCTPQEARFTSDIDPVEQMGDEDPNVDTKKAKELIERAVAALRDDSLVDARKFLDEAEKFADELKREEVRQVRQSIDSAEADKFVPGINKVADEGKCDEALAAAVEVIEGKPEGAIPTFVRKRTSKKITKCLLGQLKIDLSIGRELADSDKLKKTLTKDTLQQFQSAVTDATVKELIGRFEAPIDERRWVDAKKLLDELVQKKEAGDREYNRIMGVIRKGIAEDVASKVKSALADKTGASGMLSEVDRLIAVAEWGIKAGSAVGGAKTPKGVQLHRDSLALWSVCSGFRCSMVSPKENWTYGHADLQPALTPKDKKKETVRHATKVWRIGESSGWVLIAKKDPGTLADVAARVPVAAGWVKAADVKSADTSQWLPPGDSIVGTRVWGPLRKGQSELELGQVIKLKGNAVAVERLSDRSIITVPRHKVRFGTIGKGIRILARCDDTLKVKPAVIVKVKFPMKGDPIVTYTCKKPDGSDDKREDQLGAVRAKSAQLPRRR